MPYPVYTPLNWVDLSTPVNEANLDHMEQGIAAAATSINLLDTRLSAEEAKITGASITYKGAYSAGTYNDGDVVIYNGSLYMCTKDGTITVPETWPLNPPSLLLENIRTASYTLALTDGNLCVVMNLAGANNLTVPLNSAVPFPVGTVIALHQRGAGQTTIVATGGVTINSNSGMMKLAGLYSSAALRKYATNAWVLAGDIAA